MARSLRVSAENWKPYPPCNWKQSFPLKNEINQPSLGNMKVVSLCTVSVLWVCNITVLGGMEWWSSYSRPLYISEKEVHNESTEEEGESANAREKERRRGKKRTVYITDQRLLPLCSNYQDWLINCDNDLSNFTTCAQRKMTNTLWFHLCVGRKWTIICNCTSSSRIIYGFPSTEKKHGRSRGGNSAHFWQRPILWVWSDVEIYSTAFCDAVCPSKRPAGTKNFRRPMRMKGKAE